MNTIYEYRENEDGSFTFMIDCCSNDILETILNPDIPYVWSVNHFFEDSYDWVKRKIALSKSGEQHEVLVRGMAFDFIMETKKYLSIASEFSKQGNILIQTTKLIPQSLEYKGIPKDNRTKILIQNGMYLEFFLPHENETASCTCIDKNHVERIIEALK
ncbi:MAG: hypothetical protein GY931_11845 [Maribacter sp.]|nr:hypothetical protein [Maribacter sp.]